MDDWGRRAAMCAALGEWEIVLRLYYAVWHHDNNEGCRVAAEYRLFTSDRYREWCKRTGRHEAIYQETRRDARA